MIARHVVIAEMVVEEAVAATIAAEAVVAVVAVEAVEAADKASSLTMQMNFQHWDNLCHLRFLIQKIYSLYVCCIQRTQRIVFRLEKHTH